MNAEAAGSGSARGMGVIRSLSWGGIWLLSLILFSGCSKESHHLEPEIVYWPQERHLAELPSAFPPLPRQECASQWGKELIIGECLGRELDLYRAATAFKRAEILLPEKYKERYIEAKYGLFLSYYLGRCYREAIAVFEGSEDLQGITAEFAALPELLLALADCYTHVDQQEKAERIAPMLAGLDERRAQSLEIYQALKQADICKVREKIRFHSSAQRIMQFLDCFERKKLSVTRAQLLNAIMPGAGYLYTGQTRTAATSFVINALFGAATYQFFKKGQWAAGLITASLELGWYVGGINGAGLAAKAYNEHLYSEGAKEAMIETHLFPILLFESVF